jgi:hypothetical protein
MEYNNYGRGSGDNTMTAAAALDCAAQKHLAGATAEIH